MIEKHVTSLELSLKLKELGVKQSSLFYWVKPKSWPRHKDAPVFTVQYIHWFDELHDSVSLKEDYEYCSAFLASELGEMLPILVPFNEDGADDYSFLLIGKNTNNKWWLNYTLSYAEEENEANLRAKALIHLIENKLIEVPRGEDKK